MKEQSVHVAKLVKAFNDMIDEVQQMDNNHQMQAFYMCLDELVKRNGWSYYDPDFKTTNVGILKWGYEIQHYFSDITIKDVLFDRENKIIPWRNWTIEERTDKNNKPYLAYADGCGSPGWWKAYTAVKHARTAMDDGRVKLTLFLVARCLKVVITVITKKLSVANA